MRESFYCREEKYVNHTSSSILQHRGMATPRFHNTTPMSVARIKMWQAQSVARKGSKAKNEPSKSLLRATTGGMKILYTHLFSLQPFSVHFFLSHSDCVRYAFVIYTRKKNLIFSCFTHAIDIILNFVRVVS